MVEPTPSHFAFVPLDGSSGKLTTTGDRLVVRSHCMRGRNKRKDSRRSGQQARERQRKRQAAESFALWPTHASCTPADARGTVLAATLTSSRAFSTDLALVTFAADVDGHSQQLLYKYFTYDTMKYTYPVANCVDFNLQEIQYFNWLFDDEVYVHCTLLAASAIDDFIQQRSLSRTTYFHLWRTHCLLNERLSNPQAYQLDAILYVVMTLAVITEVLGDHAAAHAHIAGLARILQMRGGIASLSCKSKLLFKIGRLDLAWALSTGDHPRLLPDPISWGSLYTHPSSPVASSDSSDIAVARFQSFVALHLGSKLGNAFHDLQQLTRLINHHTRKSTRIEGQEFQLAINSIQSRLLRLGNASERGNDNEEADTAECLRLGMLAYLTTTFRIPGRTVGPAYLTGHFRTACRTLQPSTPELKDILFWMLMIGVISILDLHEPWLQERWDVVTEPNISWDDAQKKLLSIMWISSIHDSSGRKAYNELTTGHVKF